MGHQPVFEMINHPKLSQNFEYELIVKRFFDLVLACLLLPVLLPVMILIYIILAIFLIGIFMYLSRWSGWRNDISTQIENYKQLRRQLYEANENNLASRLLKIKIRKDINPALKQHYEALSVQSGLTPLRRNQR